MNIFLTGQCSLHWGRMEFGNIGNHYIIEPLIRELNKTFQGAKVKTTFQMSNEFCERENISVLPMELYYGWNDDLEIALKELAIAKLFNQTNTIVSKTDFIREVLSADLVIDFSGDIWGDNADFLGPNRFLVGLIKDRVAQLLGKPTVMLAGSPGPFNNQDILVFAKEVFKNFDLVTNREPLSTILLDKHGFDTTNTYNYACPSFLFETQKDFSFSNFLTNEGIKETNRPKAGFILCGWNFTEGPFDKWPRNDNDYIQFVESIEYIINDLQMDVYLMSHSNGFPVPPEPFKLQHGRDYPIIKQLEQVLIKRGIENHLFTIDGVYSTWETKAIIGNLDFIVSGRVHGAIAGLSQAVPTVIIDYGHKPKAHKLEGFANLAGVEEFIANPATSEELIAKIKLCYKNSKHISNRLAESMRDIKKSALNQFNTLRIMYEQKDI